MPAKADTAAQRAFLAGELEPRLAQARRGARTVLFVDAAHFVHGAFPGWLWSACRLFVPGPSGRKRYNVLAALDAVTHEVTRVANHAYVNAETVCELLRKVAAGAARPVTMVLDNARYQRCAPVRGLAAELGVELLFLPSYSPNLNLIERLWRFVKKEVLAARHKKDYATFVADIDACLEDLGTKHKARAKTLFQLNFQLFDEVPIIAA